MRSDLLVQATNALENSRIGAVVGLAVSHKFAYGLPASLLVLRKSDFEGPIVPDYIDARETFFIQKRLDELNLKTSYIFGSIVTHTKYRRYKPEWEGANTRILPSPMLKELSFTMRVILLLALNSRLEDILYLRIFYAKFFPRVCKSYTMDKIAKRGRGMKLINERTLFKILVERNGFLFSITTKNRAHFFLLFIQAHRHARRAHHRPLSWNRGGLRL